MGRIRIEYPTNTLFQTRLDVRITDLNYGGHVGNDTFLRYLQEARSELLSSWGWTTEKNGPEGIGLIMADVAVNYKAELFYGDAVEIDIGVQDLSRSSFDLVYRLTKISTGKVVALAKTGMVAFDYDASKVTAIPEALALKLAGKVER